MKHISVALQHEEDVEAEGIREQERLHIAQNLQDELGKHLLLLHMDLVKLCGKINQLQPDLQEAACLVMRSFGVVMLSLLTMIRGLRPAALNRGFCSAVEWQCGEFSRRLGIACHIGWSAADINLPKGLSLVLFRAFQEAIKNVHHSQASCAYVIVNTDGHTVAMTVVGNSDGIALVNQDEPTFHQLAGLKEQITDIGGKVSLCSAHNSGMVLNFELPLGGRWS